MTALLIQVVVPLMVALIAALPALIAARRAQGAADDAHGAANAACEASVSAKDTVHDRSTTVEALLFRLEGKVDALGADVREVLTWRATHDERHRHLHAVPIALAEEVVLRVKETHDYDDGEAALGHG